MEKISLENELKSNSYPGRGIISGRSADGTKAVTAYFNMGRSENSRNRVFVTEGEGIRTQAFDPSKLTDPSLIIYAPVRVLGNKTIVTNGDQTDTIYEGLDKQLTFEQFCKCLYIIWNINQFRFSFKARKRISVTFVCMNETTFAGNCFFISVCITDTGIRISIITFQNGHRIAVISILNVHHTGNSRCIIRSIRFKFTRS